MSRNLFQEKAAFARRQVGDLENHIRPYIGRMLWCLSIRTSNWEPVLIYEVVGDIFSHRPLVKVCFFIHGEKAETTIYDNFDFHARFSIDDPR